MKKSILVLLLFVSIDTVAHSELEIFSTKKILSDVNDLKALNIPTIAQDDYSGVGYAIITPHQQMMLQERSHRNGKCAGFEEIHDSEGVNAQSIDETLKSLSNIVRKDASYFQVPYARISVNSQSEIEAAVNEVSEENLRNYVQWISAFPNRYNKGSQANVAITELKKNLEALLQDSKVPWQIDFIKHNSTPQYSLRVRLIGKSNPDEVIVLGGHFDSVSMGAWGAGRSDIAPGADDNASGSANVIEALRIVMSKKQPERTIEFFWYAGEESGLLGSSEIAQKYKSENKNVIGVLQLDMTLFPGSGAGTIALMTDFTSSWLTNYLAEINKVYVGANFVMDKCGYGCSDHASWYRQGFPTIIPFEAKVNAMNKNIHTKNDIITPQLNFKHSAMFSKLAVAYALDLSNSNLKQPY